MADISRRRASLRALSVPHMARCLVCADGAYGPFAAPVAWPFWPFAGLGDRWSGVPDRLQGIDDGVPPRIRGMAVSG